MTELQARTKPGLGLLLSVLAATLVIGLDSLGFSIALATLMFSGDLAPGLSMAVTAALVSSAVLTLVIGLLSGFKPNIAGIQDIGAAILAVAISTQLAGVSADAKVATAFAIIAAATLATGVLFCLVGYLKAGRFVRYFPLEVLAGFLAATGCVLILGGIGMVAHVQANVMGALSIRSADQLSAVALGLLLGFIIYIALRYYKNPYTLLTISITATLLFHLWRWTQDVSLSEATARGLLPVVREVTTLALPFPAFLAAVDWQTVQNFVPTIVTVAVLSLFATLLNLAAVEVSASTEMDIDHELKATGVGNIFVAGAGGSPGYTNLSMTTLLRKLGVPSRKIVIGVAAILLLGGIFAQQIIALVPVFVTSAIVFYFGIDFLKEWVIDTYRRFKPREWLVVVFIVVVSLAYGLMTAIFAGLLVAAVLFAWSCAVAPVVRTATTLVSLPSTTERAPEEAARLRGLAEAVRVFQLQGFLFFGTSEQIFSRFREVARNSAVAKLQHVIIDFTRVTDLDSASANSFKRMLELAEREKISVAFCGLSKAQASILAKAGVAEGKSSRATFLADLDLALLDAEEMLLGNETRYESMTLPEHFARSSGDQKQLEKLFAKMRRTSHDPGTAIITRGAVADRVFFIESGSAVVQLNLPSGVVKRLRTMLPGAIVGDVAYVVGGTRTADVVAFSDVVTLSISTSELDQLSAKQPELATLFNRLLTRALAEKVITSNRLTEHAG